MQLILQGGRFLPLLPRGGEVAFSLASLPASYWYYICQVGRQAKHLRQSQRHLYRCERRHGSSMLGALTLSLDMVRPMGYALAIEVNFRGTHFLWPKNQIFATPGLASSFFRRHHLYLCDLGIFLGYSPKCNPLLHD